MDVHHNSKKERTKWHHYLWEFVMLFLAVFAGFLAENEREGYVERQQEKQYMKSMIQDLQVDTAQMGFIIKDFNRRIPGINICVNEFPKISNQFSYLFYNNLHLITGFEDFIPNDRTLQQLKSAGGMRMVENIKVSDSIMEYDKKIKDLLIEESIIFDYTKEFKNIFEILDADLWVNQSVLQQLNKKTMLVTNDKSLVSKYYGWIAGYRNFIPFYISQMQNTSDYATRLIYFIRSEYNL